MNKKDKVVANVYETNDYEQFKVLAENRGQKETKGIKDRKIKQLQAMIDAGTWVSEISRVKVNTRGEIVDGAHTFEVLKRNGLPIRYEIAQDERLNVTAKRDLIGSVYSINTVTTSWTAGELFKAAVQTRAPLALLLSEIIEANENFFNWTDLMGLLEKDSRYFIGRWRQSNMQTFERKDLILLANSLEFNLELKAFVKLNLKARIAQKKGEIIKAAYDILWHAGDMVNKSLFRKSLASIPETSVLSAKTQTDEGCRRMLLQHYNRSQGQDVETATVLYALKHKGLVEEVPVALSRP